MDGELPDDVWKTFVDLLQGAGAQVRPAVTEPVALALECSLGSGPSISFPLGPAGWTHAILQHGRDLTVPDDIFEVVFPE